MFLAGAAANSRAALMPNAGPVAPVPVIADSGASNHAVTAADTFGVAVLAFNASETAYAVPTQTATFGTTSTFTGVGFGGYDLTVASNEIIGATTTTDSITISTPINFAPAGLLVNGAAVTGIEVDLGGYNAGINRLNFLLPITTPTLAGSALYSTSSVLGLTPTATLYAANGTSIVSNGAFGIALAEGVNNGTSSVSSFNVRSFTFAITYSNIPAPEPTGLGLLAVAAIVIGKRR